ARRESHGPLVRAGPRVRDAADWALDGRRRRSRSIASRTSATKRRLNAGLTRARLLSLADAGLGPERGARAPARGERAAQADLREPRHDDQGEREGRRLRLRTRALSGDALQGAVAQAPRPRRRAARVHRRERGGAEVEEWVAHSR